MSLSEVKENREALVSGINGDTRFMSRITSIGLTPGCRVKVIKNDKNRPVLVYSRDTMIALNRNECKGIVQKGKHDELLKQEGIYKNFITGRKQAVSWKLA